MQLPNLKPAKTLTIAADMQMEKKNQLRVTSCSNYQYVLYVGHGR
jgi:hypothetical protein